MTNLASVPSEGTTCAHCGAPLVADQRYCLSCGQPCSPVRLAFLDVLDSERQPQPTGALVPAAPIAYASYAQESAGPAWARRYAPLFAVASVLLLAGIAGLLVGHWVSQSKGSSGPTIVKVEGLAGAPSAGASAATTPSTGATPTSTGASASSSPSKSEEAKELAEAKAEERAEEKAPAKAPPAKTLSKTEATKLEKTTGKAKEKELQKFTTAPIEVK